jgi:hypothetical protein
VASQFLDSEADRRDDVTAVLIRYLKCYSARFMISLGVSSQPSVTDGTATVLLSGVRHRPFKTLTVRDSVLQHAEDFHLMMPRVGLLRKCVRCVCMLVEQCAVMSCVCNLCR